MFAYVFSSRQEGIQIGREKEKLLIARNLIHLTSLADEDIARAADLPLEAIQRLRLES